MWYQDDTVRLSACRKMIDFCHHIAFLFGSYALALENEYNDYVNLLH